MELSVAQLPFKEGTDLLAVFTVWQCHERFGRACAERLQRRALRDNRLDDAHLEVIKKRLAIFEKETKPILDYYGPDLVHSIDSTQSPINVLRDILRVLARI